MKTKEFYFEYGLRVEDATRNGAPRAFVDRLREYAVAEKECTGRSLFGFGWTWWQNHWTLEQETKCLRFYRKLKSIKSTARKLNVTCVEVACLAHSVDKMLPEHSHRYRGSKVMTRTLAEACVKLNASCVNGKRICDQLGIKKTCLNSALRSKGVSTRRPDKAYLTETERKLIISLYKKGVVPKNMKDYGVKVAWPTAYKLLQEEGLLGLCRNNTRHDLRQLYLESNFTDTKWRAFRRLARRLTEDTYKKHRASLDPNKLRGEDWHLDHKVSVYRAFLSHWTPEQTAGISNLQMLPSLVNRQKFTGVKHESYFIAGCSESS